LPLFTLEFVAGEHDVTRAQRERLGAAQASPVEDPHQRSIADPGRVATRGLGEQRGGFIAAQSLGEFARDMSPLPRQKRWHIDGIGTSADRLKG